LEGTYKSWAVLGNVVVTPYKGGTVSFDIYVTKSALCIALKASPIFTHSPSEPKNGRNRDGELGRPK
jgi:hypothetical protein